MMTPGEVARQGGSCSGERPRQIEASLHQVSWRLRAESWGFDEVSYYLPYPG